MTDHRGLRVVCLAGKSDSGKTTLVEKLVPRLAEYGRVGTVKSIHHEIEIDTPGTDTDRHRRAGADAVVGLTPDLTFEIASTGKVDPPTDPDEGWLFGGTVDDELRALEAVLARYRRREYDFVLVEGYKEAPLSTIVVGDLPDSAVAGPIVGRDADGLETLVETIRSLGPVDG